MHNNKAQRSTPDSPKRFWIIGAGHFGQIAVRRITRHIPGASITVVDTQPLTVEESDVTVIRQDGIQWLVSMLEADAPVDMVVPMIPAHVAWLWLRQRLLEDYAIKTTEIPDAWLARLPHGMRAEAGQAYVSQADFICPDNCPEPKRICTHTGKTRPRNLFRVLDDLTLDSVLPIVLRSHQIQPGVGGIRPQDLFLAMTTIRKNADRPLMVATACRCHGMVDFMLLEEKIA